MNGRSKIPEERRNYLEGISVYRSKPREGGFHKHTSHTANPVHNALHEQFTNSIMASSI
jgi:hypothetical protein